MAGAGVLLSLYLLITRAAHAPVYCPLGSGCDIVQSSRYAAVFGIPVATLGLGYYAVLGVLAVRTMSPSRRWELALPLSFAGLSASVVFTVVQQAIIGSTCSLCLLSALLTVGLVVLLVMQRPTRAERVTWAWGVLAGAFSIALLVSGYAASAPQTAASDYTEGLAKHLTASGAVFYGAFWCPHCADQKAMFGSAARFLPYVECDPRGAGAQPQVCLAHQVRAYPTWEVGGQRIEGVLDLRALARLSGYPAPP